MSHFGDYVDGVPVKISEKYKRPPRIELPYSVTECPVRAKNVVDSIKYCTTFEQNILAKLKELKSAKETKKNERRHRLQLIEEAKQKKLDAIAAAEAEEKLKQLSVSEVSYPSTDEISALSPDDKNEKSTDTACATENNSPEADTANTDQEYLCNTQDPPLNILQPIQIQSNYQLNNLLDDPDPLQDYKMNVNMSKIPHSGQNVDMLTFKDFENDTSSPFDSVELKTINDMELLAQVLQSQRDSSASVQQTYIPDQSYANCGAQAQITDVGYLPNVYSEPTMLGTNTVYTSPQHYPMSNGYYVPDNVCDNTVPVDNIYLPNYQYFVPQPYTIPSSYYNSQMPTTSSEVPVANGTYIPQPYYYQYPPTVPYAQNTYATQEAEYVENVQSVSSHTTVKSRSRSVPDIVKELNDEVVSARQRATERSCNTSPGLVNVPRSLSNSDKKERRKNSSELLPNPYDKLPSELQSVCQKIHGMGFPIDRVARVCSLIGDSDKRVIECLLIMTELMDLGFSEGKVTAALVKHEFNKDKTLDDLVS